MFPDWHYRYGGLAEKTWPGWQSPGLFVSFGFASDVHSESKSDAIFQLADLRNVARDVRFSNGKIHSCSPDFLTESWCEARSGGTRGDEGASDDERASDNDNYRATI
jgi:hypothetical protein